MGWHGLARSRTRYPLLANAVQRLLTAMVGQDREEANRLQQSAQICGDPAEFWAQRLLAFELRRWGNAARASCCRDLQQALCAEVAIERHRKARIGRAVSADPKMLRRRPNQQYHCALCAGLWAQRERVW